MPALPGSLHQPLQSLNHLIGPLLNPLQFVHGLWWFFLDCMAENWTQHSSCGFTTAEQRGKISSLDLLAVLLLRQPWRLLSILSARACCWFRFSLAALSGPVLQSWFPPGELKCLLVHEVILHLSSPYFICLSMMMFVYVLGDCQKPY